MLTGTGPSESNGDGKEAEDDVDDEDDGMVERDEVGFLDVRCAWDCVFDFELNEAEDEGEDDEEDGIRGDVDRICPSSSIGDWANIIEEDKESEILLLYACN